ncbi:MAG: glutamate--cysteine ligase [Gammaproteobacteria bacterium]|nr:glutamate--cysteine ligase [Gammaproteobacteria bacterium]
MGLVIDRSSFDASEYVEAGHRLRENLQALELLLSRPGFGEGDPSLGAEVELTIVDADAQALPLNRQVLAESLDPHLQLELDRFNLEYNLTPVAATGTPFGTMRAELETALAALEMIAGGHGGRMVAIGILPTLRLDQLQSGAMTDLPRYRALQAAIRRIRKEDFHIRIDGAEPLDVRCDSVTMEGANTSFQVHLRTNPRDFANFYNAAQLVTPMGLAVSANSPFLLEHSLWDETRIALFKQAVDTRAPRFREWRRAARVPFGHGWVRKGAHELFAESCRLYPVLIPICGDEDVIGISAAGGVPELLELRLHQGTIWNWNRAIYDASAGGHLRIEFRALPSGPTPIDLMASAAYLVGLTVGMSRRINSFLPAFPFRYAEYNFYRAAQFSLQAEVLWPVLDDTSPATRQMTSLCTELLPLADEGLDELGVERGERRQLLGLIRDRLASRTTPASWQRRMLERVAAKSRSAALAEVVEAYLERCASGRPVSEWD